MRILRPRRADPADESGLTLVELLVALALASVVAAVLTTVVVQSFVNERRTTARVEALNEAKMTMERLVRDTRGADPLLEAEDDRVRMTVHRDSGSWLVTYTVVDDGDSLRLTVDEEDEDGNTNGRTLVAGLDPGSDVFAYLDLAGEETAVLDDIRRVRVQLEVVPTFGDGVVRLLDEVTVRNARDTDGG